MAPIFTCFVHESNKVISLHVNHVLGKYYPLLADGEAAYVHVIKSKYKDSNCRFFCYMKDEWEMVTLDNLDCMPDFVLSFDKDKVVDEQDWELVYKWIKLIFTGENDQDLFEQILELVPLPGEVENVSIESSVGKSENINKEYTFRYFIDNERDYGLFEIYKPFTDKPFTAVVRQFKKRGLLPLFTAYYVSTAWGISNYDHLFLLEIWKHLSMDKEHGELDLERRLKEDIAKCLPDNPGGPEAEPEVYRKSIDELIDQWMNKRSNEEFVQSQKKKIKTMW